MVALRDLTLRDGSQVPGLDISEEDGLAILETLDILGMEHVELSFPRAHPRESWYQRAEGLGLRSTALARAVPEDLDAALAVDPDEVEVIVPASDV
jgi:isopropylmalate/homocitrate/citramalate synthase